MRLKKLLGSVLALALMFPYSQANAELLKNLKLTGQIDLQTQSSRNVTDFTTRPAADDFTVGTTAKSYNDRINDAHTRVMLHLDWDILDDVHSKVSLVKRTRTWGTAGAGATTDARASAQQLGDTPAAGTVLGSVYVDQAYIKIDKMMGHVDATVGRQNYGTPHDIVIYYGPSDKALYGQPTTALDAARADWNPGWMGLKVTGIAGKATGSALSAHGANTTATKDVDITGIKLDAKPMEALSVGAHLYNRFTHAIGPLGHVAIPADVAPANTGGLNNSLFVYGLTFRWQDMGFNVGAQWHKNSGEDRALCTRNGACASSGVGALDGNFYNDDPNGDGVSNAFDLIPDSKYSGQAFRIDASYTAEAEGIATFIPWFDIAQGTGRGALKENKNDGFVAIRGDYRPGTIHGRFAPSGLASLGSGIPCNPGAVFGSGTASNPLCTAAASAIPNVLNTPLNTSNASAAGPGGVGSNSLNNRLIWGLGMKITPAAANQLTLGVSWWNFRLQRDTDYVVAGNTPLLVAQAPAVTGRNGVGNGNKDIGSELDIDFNWKHSDNVGLDFGLASFRPGKYIQSIVEDARTAVAGGGTHTGLSPVYLAYADLRVKF